MDDPPFTVLPLDLRPWTHPTLRWWAYWLRGRGYHGRLPAWAIWWCTTWYPERLCRCKMYAIDWRETDGCEEE